MNCHTVDHAKNTRRRFPTELVLDIRYKITNFKYEDLSHKVIRELNYLLNTFILSEA